MGIAQLFDQSCSCLLTKLLSSRALRDETTAMARARLLLSAEAVLASARARPASPRIVCLPSKRRRAQQTKQRANTH